MATIKDVAKLAGVSPATVSIVINGKSAERKIPAETCERIYEAMTVLHYQPNMSARRLRYSKNNVPTIAFFWKMDYMLSTMSYNISSIMNKINESGFHCEFIVQTYKSEHIDEICGHLSRSEYSAAIIGNASPEDISYFESLHLKIPIIFVNRKSSQYAYVCVDYMQIANSVADMLFQKGYRCVGVLTCRFPAGEQRLSCFRDRCSSLGIAVEDRHIIYTSNAEIRDGIKAGQLYLEQTDRPEVLFCNYDLLALGAVTEFKRHSIDIPGDMEVISIGMIESDVSLLMDPALTTVDIPSGKIAERCIEETIKALKNNTPLKIQEMYPPTISMRESFVL